MVVGRFNLPTVADPPHHISETLGEYAARKHGQRGQHARGQPAPLRACGVAGFLFLVGWRLCARHSATTACGLCGTGKARARAGKQTAEE